jgi:S1-C subfamily serine protease
MTLAVPSNASPLSLPARLAAALVGFVLASVSACAWAQPAPPQARPSDAAIARMAQSIVKLQAYIPPEARSAQRLGTKREGSGVVVGKDGLIVTIGYLVNEAMAVEIIDNDGKPHQATVVGFDQASGLGLVQLNDKTALPPLELGDSAALAERQPVIAAAAGGTDSVQPAFVVSRREFAGSWEYLLDRAIYTSPPLTAFGGAALIGGDGKLLGIGSLILQSVVPNQELPGNMFVPVDLLAPLLKDVAATGKPRGAERPWLGMNIDEIQAGMLIVGSVSKDGPAGKAGIQRGDVVLSIGKTRFQGLADFYRRVWALGEPGVDVPLEMMQRDGFRQLTIKSSDRSRYLKLQPTY